VTWAIYGLLLVVAVVLLLLPEPDFALVTKNTWPAAAPARRASHTRCRDRRRLSRLSRQARCEQQVGAQPPPGTASARPRRTGYRSSEAELSAVRKLNPFGTCD
jgi:hypothetical protein